MPRHVLAEFQRDFRPGGAGIIDPLHIRGSDHLARHQPIVVLFHQGTHQRGELLVACHIVMARRTTWHDTEGAHDPHVGVEIRQRPLYLPQRVVGRNCGTGRRPDLEDVVVAEVGKILFPSIGHLHKQLLIGCPVAGGPIHPLVGLTLMPEHGPYPVRQLGRPHAGQQVGVYRITAASTPMILWIRLVLVNARAADGPVDDANGHAVTLDQVTGQSHAPIPDAIGVAAGA